MLYVRYPNGTVITYNDANKVKHYTDHMVLVETKNDTDYWLAVVPYSSGAIVESGKPCKVENALTPEHYLDYVAENLKQYNGYWNKKRLAKLKAALKDFNSVRGEWK